MEEITELVVDITVTAAAEEATTEEAGVIIINDGGIMPVEAEFTAAEWIRDGVVVDEPKWWL